MSFIKRRFKILHLSTVSFKILEFNDACSMRISCIPHCSYLHPAVTISELQDVRTVISIIPAPCNTGQCEGDAVILSLFVINHSPDKMTLLSTVITLILLIGLGSLAEVISCQSELGLRSSVESSLLSSSS